MKISLQSAKRHFCDFRRVSHLIFIFCVINDRLISASANYDCNSNKFVRLTTSGVTIEASSSFETPSIISCSTNCVSKNQSSYFAYNEDSRSCSCGSSLIAGSVDAAQRLYRHAHAPEDIPETSSSKCSSYANEGFTFYSLADTDVCLMASTTSHEYYEGEDACDGYLGGRLFVSDTAEKLNLLNTNGMISLTTGKKTHLFRSGKKRYHHTMFCLL